MQDCCESIYNKVYNKATECCNISNVTQIYDPVKFGKWLSDAFEASSFKSFSQLASVVGFSRATISRYAGAKEQTLTNKPSQPNTALVINLALALDKDVNEALQMAGHASVKDSESESFQILPGVNLIFYNLANWVEDERLRAVEAVRTVLMGVKAQSNPNALWAAVSPSKRAEEKMNRDDSIEKLQKANPAFQFPFKLGKVVNKTDEDKQGKKDKKNHS
jgi:hypothetical protein